MTDTYESTPAPGNPALTLEDFEEMPRGTIVRLHYNCFNRGSLVWKHISVRDGRVRGYIQGPRGGFCNPGPMLYVHEGMVSMGSGAEPLHFAMPADIGDGVSFRYPRNDAERDLIIQRNSRLAEASK